MTRDKAAPPSHEVVVRQLIETIEHRDRLLLLLDRRMTDRIATLERTLCELQRRIDELENGAGQGSSSRTRSAEESPKGNPSDARS